jgi:hypothetical protein
VPQWFHGQRRVQRRIQQQQQTAGPVVSAPDIPGAAVPGRVGKNPDFFFNPAQWVFWVFLVFFGVFWVFFYKFAQKREFLGFFS